MAHRKWEENKLQPSLLPGPAVPGCSLLSFHVLWAILCPQALSQGVNSIDIRFYIITTSIYWKLSSSQAQLIQDTCLAVA